MEGGVLTATDGVPSGRRAQVSPRGARHDGRSTPLDGTPALPYIYIYNVM